MKTQALIVLIPFAMLAACARKEPPPAAAPAAATAATTASATAAVTISGTPDNGVAPGTPTAPTNPAAPNPTAPANPVPSTNPDTSSINGTLQLAATSDGVQITGTIAGLAPNTEHGFHIHETGDCSTLGFATAGGHFNPDAAPHGDPIMGTMHHLGDIPELKSDGSGNATVNASIAGVTLRDAGPHDLLGKAFIVHAKRDDYSTQPSGDSGDRIACGVIR